jgi:hypothetical protein
MDDLIHWLLHCDEPWTRYRTLVDLLGRPESDPKVLEARLAMLAHPQIQVLIAEASGWGERPIKRHNDASHPIYKLSTLADFGLRAGDPGMAEVMSSVLAHQSVQGAFQSPVNIPQAFGGNGEDQWTWLACDAPTLLYALLAMGMGDDERVQRAIAHLVGLGSDLGWGCAAAPELGKFKGPGRKSDPCPIANVLALKALDQVPEQLDSPAARAGVEMLLRHWEERGQKKYFLFGIGGDFVKLKYPFIWYDILHVVDVLSRFPFARRDPRLQEMLGVITACQDDQGRYTASSMYQVWKGWSFADKKMPSPWLTFLALRMEKRMERL